MFNALMTFDSIIKRQQETRVGFCIGDPETDDGNHRYVGSIDNTNSLQEDDLNRLLMVMKITLNRFRLS